jgi:hypothetical protein
MNWWFDLVVGRWLLWVVGWTELTVLNDEVEGSS